MANGLPSKASGSTGTTEDLQFQNNLVLADSTIANQTTTSGAWGYKSLTVSGNTAVKTGAGQFHALITGTATGNITIYDGTDNTGAVILATSALVVGTSTYDVGFNIGLFIVLSGAGVATVSYR